MNLYKIINAENVLKLFIQENEILEIHDHPAIIKSKFSFTSTN